MKAGLRAGVVVSGNLISVLAQERTTTGGLTHIGAWG
jgi:hypothetical protein